MRTILWVRRNLKSKLFLVATTFSTIGLAVLGNVSAASALSGAYSASDVLGESNFTSTVTGASATSYGSNNGGNWGSTAIDTVHHRLFVSDPYNNRVLVYNLDANNNLVSHAANNVLGEANMTDTSNSGSTASTLSTPTGLAYDPVNNRLFVETDPDVAVFDLSHGITDDMDASYELGQVTFGDNDCTESRKNFCPGPGGLAFDPVNDRLFVGNEDNNSVLVFNVSPSHISSGENADHILGQPNFTTSGGSTTQRTFSQLEYAGIAYNDVTEQLFVADPGSDRVLEFDLSNGISDYMLASHVIGQTNFSDTTSAGASQTSIGESYGLGIDTQSDQLFVDGTNAYCRVLIFNLANGISDGMKASGVLGQSNFTDDGCATSQTGFGGAAYDQSIAFDQTQGRLYVPNYTDSRVLIFDFVHLTNVGATTTSGTSVRLNLNSVSTGSSYSVSLAPVHYQGTLTFTITSGHLPPGLVLNSHTGVISGEPTTPGTYNFEVKVTDDIGAAGVIVEDPGYSITVDPAAPDTGFGTPGNSVLLIEITALFGLAAAAFGAAKLVKR